MIIQTSVLPSCTAPPWQFSSLPQRRLTDPSGNSNTDIPYFQCRSYPQSHTSNNPHINCRMPLGIVCIAICPRSLPAKIRFCHDADVHLPPYKYISDPLACKCLHPHPTDRFRFAVPFVLLSAASHTSPEYT